MPIEIGPTRRLAAVATAPVGAALTSWSYIWRITPIHRRLLEGSLDEDAPPPLPDGAARDDVQLPEDGSGPLFRRVYTGVFRKPSLDAAKLIERLSEDPNRVVPLALARFKKTHGEDWRMRVGDEFLVRMPGPWDGPVRTVEVTDTSFRFATLEGHLEAGQIEWRAQDRDGDLVFQVESRSRAGDRFSAVLHDHFPMAREVQLHMWTSVVEHVGRESGGQLTGGVDVETRRVEADAWES
jgi:hypothetical protein